MSNSEILNIVYILLFNLFIDVIIIYTAIFLSRIGK